MATLGYRAEIDAGQRFIENIEPDETVVLLFHDDADGSCAAAIVYRTLMQMGDELIFPIFMQKQENIYSDTVSQRILARDPSYLIVLDAGSRTQAIVPGITTMVIDHHKPQGIPPVDVFINSCGVQPPATASMVAYQICKDFALTGGLEWLAAVGTVADMGDTDLDVVKMAKDQYGMKAIKETASLINAARRSASHDTASAFEALIQADSPLDIVEGAIPQAIVLRSYREEVNSEFKRVLKIAPRISGQWALIPFRSSSLVHALVAIAWTQRLSYNIVIAANYGYTEGNVHFSVRSAQDMDLMNELSKYRPEGVETDFAHGHARATGGILPLDKFNEFLKNIGFSPEAVEV